MTTDHPLASSRSDDRSTARLTLSRILPTDPDGLCDLFADPSWLGDEVTAADGHPQMRRVLTDLAFGLRGEPRGVVFRKAAFVDLGVRHDPTGGCVGEVAWRAAGMAPLFPVFAGTLSVHDGGLHLNGVYTPPGGGVGLLVDRAVLHHVAERTGGWFLDRVIAALEDRQAH